MDDTQITYIGKTDFHNKLTTFGIKAIDRTKHTYIIGKTGTGKSTFLENMIVQDIQNGNGLAFIDPHGGSVQKILDYIPEWRLDDVIYLNPSDFQFPIAFNPLEDPGPDKRHLIADGLMSVFKKVWPDAFSGRMEYILNNTMLSLLEYPDSTVLSINRMLTDKDFRKKVVAATTDSAVRNAWDELMKWDDKRWSEAVSALINKVGQFSTNPVIRNIVGQPKSTFDFRQAMDERKIVLINLSKGLIGEQNAPLLGAMFITKIYLAAMSRSELPNHVIDKMPPFYFYVDEFQNFANESFASILSEARKYKLALTVANQFIAQMEETIRDAVFGNMGTTIAFRVGPLDAEFMERVFAPVFTQEDLQNIAFGQFFISLQIDGMGSKPFSAQGLGPISPPEMSLQDKVIEKSRKNYARLREDVEKSIRVFFGYDQKDAKIIASVSGDKPVIAQPKPSFNKSEEGNQKFQPPKKQKIYEPKQSIHAKKLAPVVKNSSSLNDLLKQLDNVAAVPEKKEVEVKPEAKQEVKVSPAPQRPAKELTRLADPDKKMALQEALAKALSGTTNTKKEEPKEEKKEKQPEQPIQPKIKHHEPPAPVIHKEGVREVPEDILRSVLE